MSCLMQLLVEDAERREQPHAFEAELVELGDTRVAVAVLGRDRLAFAQELVRLQLVRVAAEVVVHRAGLGDRVERGVDDRVAHDAADDVVLAPVHLAPLHAARLHLRVDVAGERVERLVVVVVGVERGVGKVAHAPSLLRRARCVHSGRGPIDSTRSSISTGRRSSRGARRCANRAPARSPASSAPEALPAFIADARGLAPLAHRSGGLGTVYLGFPDETFPLDHPRQWLGNYGLGAVAYDLFPPDSPIRRLFEWDELRAFVAAILGLDTIYPLRRPARRAEPRGDGRRRRAAVALRPDRLRRLARAADADEGGDFEVAPFIRTADDERYDDVAACSPANATDVTVLPMTPGTLLRVRGPATRCTACRRSRRDAAPRRAVRLRHEARHDEQRAVEGRALRAQRRVDVDADASARLRRRRARTRRTSTRCSAPRTGPVGVAWATALATPRAGHAAVRGGRRSRTFR